jgi:hypothetical protein
VSRRKAVFAEFGRFLSAPDELLLAVVVFLLPAALGSKSKDQGVRRSSKAPKNVGDGHGRRGSLQKLQVPDCNLTVFAELARRRFQRFYLYDALHKSISDCDVFRVPTSFLP